MSYSLVFTDKKKYLHVQVTGTNSVETVRSYTSEIFQMCDAKAIRAVLIEENLAGPGLPLSDIFQLVSGASKQILKMPWIAVVDINPAHNQDHMKFAENVGVNRGIKLRAFPDVASAEKWLLELPQNL